METSSDDVENDKPSAVHRKSSSLIGTVTAAGRSLVYQLTTFYLRSPMKLFRPVRYDFKDYLKVMLQEDEKPLKELTGRSRFWNPKYTYYLENSTVGVLTKAVNRYGWKVVHERIIPPIVLNSAAGIVLYTTYLVTLERFTGGKTETAAVHNVAMAGFLAGTAHAVTSAPIDAIHIRSMASNATSANNHPKNLWFYGIDKFKEIGLTKCFGGFGLSLVKESIGFAAYFTTFECFKGQVCDWFLARLKRHRLEKTKDADIVIGNSEVLGQREVNWIQRAFIFIGGVSAAFILQVIQFPLLNLQKMHVSRLETLDIRQCSPNNSAEQAARLLRKGKMSKSLSSLYLYFDLYRDTLHQVRSFNKNGKIIPSLYKGFTRNTLAVIPGTTAGLILLEYMRHTLQDE
ncbi:HDL130Cp [Eremothecium sinecaudum]|uniref:HDL130Cp n=1 Tax=Eremothecium sinecaudum TaxID=45286 RepID=A0A0X8HSG3_9SACH|nr:HDL130Cp [Eremothecium sinecaudum]AMD20614.1 HDL130Cp [Eremothecium sinecaudum]